MSERCFYKVENKQSALFKKASDFLTKEENLRNMQKETIVAKLPKFSKYKTERGFNRIPIYKGFVFENPENLDPKVWNTKKENGMMVSFPNPRTKAGKEMKKFLLSFERTDIWDLDRVLGIDKFSINGEFYQSNMFKHKDCVYIFIDSQYREEFEKNNTDLIEITYGEMKGAIDSYNKANA